MRMGVDKTLLTVDGIPLVSRVAHVTAECCANTMIVTNRPDALLVAELPPGASIVPDEVAYLGPLGGLATALANTRDEWVLAVAADMPWLSCKVIRALWDRRDGADVVVPITTKGAEPLLALYRREPCLPAARAAIDAGRRRLVAIFGNVNVVEVPIESLREADPGLLSFVNVNTPTDLAEVRDASSAASPAAALASAPSEPIHLTVLEPGARKGRGMPSERAITLYMNDVEVATVQATPRDLEDMAVGFLVAEGLMSDRAAFQAVEADSKRGLVYVTTAESVPDDMVYKRRYVTSGCGKGVTFSSLGHAKGLDHVTSDERVRSETLYELMGDMAHAAEQYRDTGGTHACGLARGGELVLVREDVGRHNALDKLLGRAWLDNTPTHDGVLLSTGRISYEMAVKAAKARVPVAATRSSVTDLAAEIADELGITLVGYVRGGKLVVYTHAERVLLPKEA